MTFLCDNMSCRQSTGELELTGYQGVFDVGIALEHPYGCYLMRTRTGHGIRLWKVERAIMDQPGAFPMPGSKFHPIFTTSSPSIFTDARYQFESLSNRQC